MSATPTATTAAPLADFASSVIAAQATTFRAVAHQLAHSARVMLAFTPGAWTPPNARNAFGAGAEKLAGSPKDVVVGFETSFTRAVTTELIEAFGEVSGDESRLHYDEEYAARTRFGGRIAHGLLAGSFVSAALSRIPGVVVYLSQDLKFTAPVRPGDEVTARVTVVERPEGKAWARLRTVCTLADGTVCADGEAKVLLMDETP